MLKPPMLRVAEFIEITEVEGPGRRAAIWVQGCSIRCPGCCNPSYLDPAGGRDEEPVEFARRIALAAKVHSLEGITLLGGEPFDQAPALELFLTALRAVSPLGIIVFSGHPWERIEGEPAWQGILRHCDLVKAGPWNPAMAPDSRAWIGSRNQTLQFLSPRYRWLEAAWPPARREIEIHLRDGEIVVNGTPLAEDEGFRADSPTSRRS